MTIAVYYKPYYGRMTGQPERQSNNNIDALCFFFVIAYMNDSLTENM